MKVVRAFLLADGKVLLAHRRPPDRVWATVGGKCESGESFESALKREIVEELGVEVRNFQQIGMRASTPDGESAEIAVYVVTKWVGRPRNAAPHEHSSIQWFAKEEVVGLRMHEQAKKEALAILGERVST